MTQDEKITDIIDIDPATVVENDAPKATPQRKLNFGIFGLSAGALLLSAVLGAWLYKDVLANYFPSNQMRSLQMRMDAIDKADKDVAEKLNAIVGLTDEFKSELGAAQAAAQDARKLASDANSGADGLNTKIAALEKSLGLASAAIDALKSKTSTGTTTIVSGDSAGLTARVENLEKELALLKSLNASAKAETSQLSQTFADLKAKIASGAEFQTEIQSISVMVPAAEGLDVLSSDAAQGISTVQTLSDKLKDFAAHATKPAESAPAQDDSWWGKTTGLFSGLVVIRNTGEIDWAPLAAQGASLIDQGKLEDAVKLLEQNLNVMPQALQDWRITANKRIAADRAVEQLGRAVSRQIAAKG